MKNISSKITLMSLSLGLSSCIIKSPTPKPGNQGSALTSIKLKIPDKVNGTDVTGKITGYSLSIKKFDGTCTFTDIERAAAVSTLETDIDASLKQECGYRILISFGRASQDGKTLDEVYLTNDKHDDIEAKPTSVEQTQLVGKTTLEISSCISVTKAGSTALGVAIAECATVSTKDVDAKIQPVIAKPTETDEFAAIKPIISTKCSGCHGDVTNKDKWTISESDFKANLDKIKTEVASERMPKGGTLTAEEKTKFANFSK